MKFGSQLKDAIYPEWTEYYVDYDGLKKRLRKAEKDKPFTEKDETEFVELLDSNLEKVYAFHQEKMEEIRKRIDEWDEKINTQIPSEDNISEMTHIQENINWIADDINRLSRFSRLNYTGFLKIVKKHDRHTDYVLRPMFMVRLNQCPFWNEDNDSLLIKLSQLFSKVRQGGMTMSFKPSSFSPFELEEQSENNRRLIVKRYFVQTENVLELKTYVLRHLPVLVYRDNFRNQDDIDPPISSVYLDDAELDSYNSRVEGAEGSQIIRLRWYGSAKGNSSIAFERRTLSEESRGELKDRFTIKDKYVTGFIHGDQTFLEKSVRKMKNSGKSQEEIEKYERLVREVQENIMAKKMQPVLRTYYRRTAFQIPGDRSVRMALDTDLCFIREDSLLFPDDPVVRRPDGTWRRPDVDIDFPFANLKNEQEINRYPFATFEIKLELAPNEKEPEWIVDLEENGILEEANDFSKFVHGVAVMFDTRVPLLPYWLAQMDDNLEKLPILPSSTPSVRPHKSKGKPSQEFESLESPSTSSSAAVVSNERSSLLGDSKQSPTSYMGINHPALSPVPEDESERQDHVASRMLDKFVASFNRFLNNHSQPQQKQDQPPVILPPGVKIPKKVITPLRVEPKVFFANERTYFAWMSFGTLLSTFSLALFNAGDAVGKLSGLVYTLVSISTLIYGMGLYYRRRELIRNRSAGPYDELMGPTLICFALMFAVGLNAYLKFAVKSPSLFYL
ncbi:SPX-domain-containing protein [Rhizopus microsporus var. microsporus]|uniref:SPX-domain-containing protein n=2 Tax=Rhizopus microsporus TaxID=58291 RepID=A0A2G4T6A1_RHIZD|nr:SPX-domain-containing protein [Rhizopus microsporus ATCC 52813]ORE06344.1 SPX-domain-containing protein [Rhizopus microsporus var. microsporus]PHZ16542.1 SPX-domain-containing protein [Rhizopus microsporus ATCC 52813]